MAGVSGIECLLEVQLREGAVFRLSGPGAGGPVSIGATYADLARLLAGERPILFAPRMAVVSDWPTVGVAGARGVVGGVFLSILADAGLPAGSLRAFGSEAGDGRLRRRIGAGPAARRGRGSASWTSCSWPPTAPPRAQIVEGPGRAVPLIVDNSSAYRLDPEVPLVVPEANGHALGRRAGNLVANPNCTTAAAVVALAPIRDLAGLESVDLASYQAVSGAGRAGLDAYEAERAAGGIAQRGRLAVPRPDRRQRGAADRRARRRGLDVARSARSWPSCARSWSCRTWTCPPPRCACRSTPATRSRCTSARSREVPLQDVMEALAAAPGLEYRHATGSDRHPMPLDVVGRDPVLVGRLRAIPGRQRGLALFLSLGQPAQGRRPERDPGGGLRGS